jgi:hypothetical protein
MTETLTAALITGGFMLVTIILNELFFHIRKKGARHKAFFNDFFPERLKAHQEILRAVTECKITYLRPNIQSPAIIKETLVNGRQTLEETFFNNILWANKNVSGCMLDLSQAMSAAIEHKETEQNVKTELVNLVAELQGKHTMLIKLLRENSGIDIIDDEFSDIVKDWEDKRRRTKNNKSEHKET